MPKSTIARRSKKPLLTVVGVALLFAAFIGIGELAHLNVFGSGWRTSWAAPVLRILSSLADHSGFGHLGFIGVTALIVGSAWLFFTITHYLLAEDSFHRTLPWEQDEVNARSVPNNIAAQSLPMVVYRQQDPPDTPEFIFRTAQWTINPVAWIVSGLDCTRLLLLSGINRVLHRFNIGGEPAWKLLRRSISWLLSFALLLPLRGLERLYNGPSDLIRYCIRALVLRCSPNRQFLGSELADALLDEEAQQRLGPPLAITDQSYAASTPPTSHPNGPPVDYERLMEYPTDDQDDAKHSEMPESLATAELNNQGNPADVQYEHTIDAQTGQIEVTRTEAGKVTGIARYKPAQQLAQPTNPTREERETTAQIRKQQAAAKRQRDKKEREESNLRVGQGFIDRTKILDAVAQTEQLAAQTEKFAAQTEQLAAETMRLAVQTTQLTAQTVQQLDQQAEQIQWLMQQVPQQPPSHLVSTVPPTVLPVMPPLAASSTLPPPAVLFPLAADNVADALLDEEAQQRLGSPLAITDQNYGVRTPLNNPQPNGPQADYERFIEYPVDNQDDAKYSEMPESLMKAELNNQRNPDVQYKHTIDAQTGQIEVTRTEAGKVTGSARYKPAQQLAQPTDPTREERETTTQIRKQQAVAKRQRDKEETEELNLRVGQGFIDRTKISDTVAETTRLAGQTEQFAARTEQSAARTEQKVEQTMQQLKQVQQEADHQAAHQAAQIQWLMEQMPQRPPSALIPTVPPTVLPVTPPLAAPSTLAPAAVLFPPAAPIEPNFNREPDESKSPTPSNSTQTLE